jgi:hypothetical protein
VSTFRVTYVSYSDLFKRLVWEQNCSYHQSTYVVPRLNKIRTYRVSQKMPKIGVFFTKYQFNIIFSQNYTISIEFLGHPLSIFFIQTWYHIYKLMNGMYFLPFQTHRKTQEALKANQENRFFQPK